MNKSVHVVGHMLMGALVLALSSCLTHGEASTAAPGHWAGAPESMSAEELGGAYALASQGEDDAEARRRLEAASSATEIASYLDLRRDGSIDFLINSAVEGAPPGVTQSYGLRLDRDRKDFSERLVKVMKLVADGMPSGTIEAGALDAPLGRVILRPADNVRFTHVIDVLEACVRPEVRLWNVVFERTAAEGTKQQLPTPLRLPQAESADGQEKSLEVHVSVLLLGGEADAKEGEQRTLMYALAFPQNPAGEGMVSTAIAVSSPKALAGPLRKARETHPAARILLRVDARAKYGEVLDLLIALEATDLAPNGFGHLDG